MARQRMLKPSFFSDRRVVACSPLARLLFTGTWGLADREGRLEDDAVDLKIRLLPVDPCDPAALLDELEKQGLIIRYRVNGHAYMAIPNFAKHQHPHPKEPDSTIPPPPPTAKKRRVRPRRGQARPPVGQGCPPVSKRRPSVTTNGPDVTNGVQHASIDKSELPITSASYDDWPGLYTASQLPAVFFRGEPVASPSESESESESELEASSLPSSPPNLRVVPPPTQAPEEEAEKAEAVEPTQLPLVMLTAITPPRSEASPLEASSEIACARADPPSAPNLEADMETEVFWTWSQLLAAWALIRQHAGLEPEDVAPKTERLFAADLRKTTAQQWSECLWRYVDPEGSGGLDAARKKYPLRMLIGRVRSDRMPAREARRPLCGLCREPMDDVCRHPETGGPICYPCLIPFNNAAAVARMQGGGP